MKTWILHMSQDAGGIVEFAVVQVGQGGERFGVPRGAAGVQRAMKRQTQLAPEAYEFAHQHRHIAVGIEEAIAGGHLRLGGGICRQQTLLHHLAQAQLGRTMGAEQSRMGG